MTNLQRWTAAGFFVLLSTAVASYYVVTNDGRGSGDLVPMALWSTPLAILVSFVLAATKRALWQRARARQGIALAVNGAICAIVWFYALGMIVGSGLLAFSFPIGLIWLVAGVLTGVLAAWMPSRMPLLQEDRNEDGTLAPAGRSVETNVPPISDSTHVKFALLALGSLMSVFVGLIPSILTVVGLLMLPVAVIAIMGAFNPRAVLSRPWMRQACVTGAVVCALEWIAVPTLYITSLRRPATLVVTSPAPAQVRIMYDIENGESRSFSWRRRYTANAGGLVYTRYKRDNGGYKYGDPFPVDVVTRDASGRMDTIGGTWIRGGYTTSGSCKLSFDEFAIGDTSATRFALLDSTSRWLDSIPAWRVRCSDGRLHAIDGRDSTGVLVQRTGEECYYRRSGVLACDMRPVGK